MGKKLPTFQWATAARKPPEQCLATTITMDSGQSPPFMAHLMLQYPLHYVCAKGAQSSSIKEEDVGLSIQTQSNCVGAIWEDPCLFKREVYSTVGREKVIENNKIKS